MVPENQTEVHEMQELQVRSRIISSVYFDPNDGRLRIVFRNGEERIFGKVPERSALELVSAPSPGNYYIDHIRTRFRRVAA
jgi:hypothetical protein